MDKGHEIKVLDHGYVKLVDSLGSDETIVEAARMSTGRGFVDWEPYRRCNKCDRVDSFSFVGPCACGATDYQLFPRGDLGILDYLYRNRHTTPFEMCELVIDVMVPMDAWRQWIRHRTANVNEYSTRYSEAIDVAARTEPGAWRTQGKTNRQGSGEFLPAGEGAPILRQDLRLSSDGAMVDFSRTEAPGHYLSNQEKTLQDFARQVYEDRLSLGVAKEQARKDLPLSTYTAARWKCDLKNVLHFLGLRMHSHAQLEIRLYANAVGEIVKALWPRTFALFEEHDLYGVKLSRTEVAVLCRLLGYDGADERAVEQKQREAIRTKLGMNA